MTTSRWRSTRTTSWKGLSVIETKYVRFSFTTAPKPAMITAQADADGEDQDDYRYLVMPVRLPN